MFFLKPSRLLRGCLDTLTGEGHSSPFKGEGSNAEDVLSDFGEVDRKIDCTFFVEGKDVVNVFDLGVEVLGFTGFVLTHRSENGVSFVAK